MTTANRVGAFVATAILVFGIAMPAKADLVKDAMNLKTPKSRRQG